MEKFNDDLSMCFELQDIVEVKEEGYKNCYDIFVEGDHSFLLAKGIVSHNWAFGGLQSVLGRKGIGYYCLKGKPLNAYSSSHKKFLENKELTGLYQVLTNQLQTEDLEDGKYYELEVNGEKIIANENDEVLIDGNWVKVKDLL